MKIIVCEDIREDRDALVFFIKRFFNEINCPVEITVYENGDSFLSALTALDAGDIKIAFLDIYMPGISGIDVAKKIRETDGDMVVVFTTTSLEHGLDGYSVGALQYLVKPVGYPAVENVLNKCAKLFADSIRAIEVFSDRLTVRVLLKDILYIEVFDHACLIHTMSETIKNYRPLDEIERQLDGDAFLRTHRSFIVNMQYIKSIAENDFLLTNGVMIPIRRSNKPAVKQAYMDYVFALARGGK
jgi:DNA-binding LytR/AlgR family response regulator